MSKRMAPKDRKDCLQESSRRSAWVRSGQHFVVLQTIDYGGVVYSLERFTLAMSQWAVVIESGMIEIVHPTGCTGVVQRPASGCSLATGNSDSRIIFTSFILLIHLYSCGMNWRHLPAICLASWLGWLGWLDWLDWLGWVMVARTGFVPSHPMRSGSIGRTTNGSR